MKTWTALVIAVIASCPAAHADENADDLLRRGTALLESGGFAKAEPLLQRAAAVSRPAVDTWIAARNNLAALYRRTGRIVEAERLHREVLGAKEQIYGARHSQVAITLNNLAEVQRTGGNLRAAEETARRALAIAESPSSNSPTSLLASTVHTLGLIEVSQGTLESAAERFQRAAALFSESPQRRRVSLTALGSVRTRQARYTEAETVLRRARELLEPGAPALDRASLFNNLAQVLKLTGRYAEADPLYRSAIAAWEEAGAQSTVEYAMVVANLADLFRAERKQNGAAKLYERAMTLLEKNGHGARPEMLDLRARLNAVKAETQINNDLVSVGELRRGY